MSLKIDGADIIRLYDKNESAGETSATEIFKLVDQGEVVFRRPLINFNYSYISSNYSTQRRTYQLEQITNPGDPYRSGYSFKGWYTSPSGTAPKLYFPRTVPNQDEITFYARWEVDIPALKGTMSGGTGEYNRDEYELVVYFNNPNNFPVRIDMSVYADWGSLLRTDSQVDVRAKDSHSMYFRIPTYKYEWKAVASQYHSPLANSNQGNNQFTVSVQSSGYREGYEETTTR